MNKIIIDNNKLLDYSDKYVIINNNSIKFIKDSDYKIEITNTKKLDLNIELNPHINVSIFIYSTNNNIKTNIKYTLEENSNLLIYKFYNNTKIINKEEVYLNGINSSFDYKLSSISKNIEEYNMTIYHNNINVKSNISNKCVGLDGSKISFIIDSVLEKGNTNCYMNQDTKIICLGDVDAKIEPNMLIDEDDVEARHGSVIGKFNYDNLFYLMTRGIDENDAKSLMTKGFILSHLNLSKEDEDKIIEIIKKEIEQEV